MLRSQAEALRSLAVSSPRLKDWYGFRRLALGGSSNYRLWNLNALALASIRSTALRESSVHAQVSDNGTFKGI